MSIHSGIPFSGGVCHNGKDGTGTEGGTLLPSSYFELTVVPQKSVNVTGGGYGHGVE